MGADIQKILDRVRIKLGDNFDDEPVVLLVDSIGIGTLGNISASVGKAKSGKTFNVLAIVSTVLSNKAILGYSANLPINKNRVLYFDTEQSRFHCNKVMNRIAALSGLSEEKLQERLYYFMLREFSVNERVNLIDNALKNIANIGLIVIDGLRDLLYDFNCPIESSKLINKLMLWSSQYMLHIHTVLHLNKADSNPRGHLGSELQQKCESILHVQKKESNVCMVNPLLTRDKEFNSFTFRINENGIPEIDLNCSYKQSHINRGIKFDMITEEQHRQALNIAFGKKVIIGYANITKALKEGYASIGLDLGNNRIIALNQYLKVNNILVAEGKGYKFNDDFNIKTLLNHE